MKKILCWVLICAVLGAQILIPMPLKVQAAGTSVIYFDNAGTNWSNVNVYTWNDSGATTGEWPGTAMSYLSGSIYTYEIPTDATYIIFNDGSSQTADLTIPTDGKNLYVSGSGSWSTYSDECIHSWSGGRCTVCGFVCDHNWIDGTCSTCGSTCGHKWSNGTCLVCSLVCGHPNWVDGACVNCSWTCSHSYENGLCTICGLSDGTQPVSFYLVGYINGANYGCEEDAANMGEYKFVDGKLVATLETDSYVFLKTEGNANWYMARIYGTSIQCDFYNVSTGAGEKMLVPGGVELTFTLTDQGDDHYLLSYTTPAMSCSHESHDLDGICTSCGSQLTHHYVDGVCSCGATEPVTEEVEYFLFGYINGANYGCEEDAANMGEYKFVDGKLTATFTQDSYVGVKTTGNADWFMTNGYVGEINGARLYNTTTLGNPDKLYVPGNVELVFELVVNWDNTLNLSYSEAPCEHSYENGSCIYCGAEDPAQSPGSYKLVTDLSQINAGGDFVLVANNNGTNRAMGTVQDGTSFAAVDVTVSGDTVTGTDLPVFTLTPADGGVTVSVDGTALEFGITGILVVSQGTNGYKIVSKDLSTYGLLYQISADTFGVFNTTTATGSDYIAELQAYKYQEGCVHSYEGVITKAPGCETQGLMTYVCGNCGESYTEAIPQAGHTWNVQSTTPAGCETQGVIEKKCSGCGGISFEYIPATGHSYVNGICTGCGASDGTVAPATATIYFDAVAIGWTNVNVYAWNDAGTCTGEWPGSAMTLVGGSVYAYEVPQNAVNIIFNNGTSQTGDLTIPTDGKNLYTYSTDSWSVYTAQCGHSYSSQVTTAAGCETAGVKTYTCSNCGDSYTESIAATGHSYTSSVTTAATCTTAGVKTYTCSNCGDTYTESIAAIGHSYVDGTCTVCGESDGTVTPTTVTIYFDAASTNWTAVNVYAWNDAGNCTGDWPGSAMTLVEGTVYSYEVPVEATKIIFNDGSSQTSDLDIPTDGKNLYTYSTSTWSVYGEETPVDPVDTTYYLVGYINGANYGCDEDYENMGEYKFVDGKLTATFTADSYVFVKTEGNGKWLMAESYCTDTTCTFSEGKTEKMYVPANTALTFTLVENADGSVTVSYVTAAASTVPTLKLSFPTLTFEDMISMNVYFTATDIADVVEMGMITYSSQVTDYGIDTAEKVVPGYTWSDTYQMYVITTGAIAAKDMSDTIYFAAYAKLADGTYAYSALVSYSPTSYAYDQLSTGSDSLKNLMIAMLNYGAEAQTFFSYRTDALMNASLTAAQKASIESYRSDMMDSVASVSTTKAANFTRTSTGFTSRYPSISFEGAFQINYYCVPSAVPAGEITLYYWNQADFDAVSVLSTSNATGAITMTAGTDRYEAAVTGIAAKDLDKGIYVAFVYSDGTTSYCSGILGYSIGAYCVANAATTDAIAPFAAATAVYGYYAKQFFNV